MDDDLADDALLNRFLAGDQAALQAVVERHARMVFLTCQRILGGDRALAEDAAQAVFVVLVRKASTLAAHPDLGGWLHRTATYAASNARRAEAQRQQREAVAAEHLQQERTMPHDPTWDEARPLLDAAIVDLRPAQREAVVLCLLEGRTQGEVARRCGCSQQAVQQRLASGLEALRRFLRRRGVVIPAAALSLGLGGEATAACPDGLVQACGAAAAGGPLPASTLAISRGVLDMLLFAKLKLLLLLAGLAVLLGGLGFAVALRAGETPPPPVQPAVVVAPAGGPVVNGLRLVLRMDQTAIREGEPWTGQVVAENAGTTDLAVFPRGKCEIVLTRSDGLPAERTALMPSGFFDTKALRTSVRPLRPGQATPIFSFKLAKPGPYSALGGRGANLSYAEYRLTAGTYRLAVRFSEDGGFPKRVGVETPVWTGMVESNPATVQVAEQLIDAPIVQGLQVIISGNGENLGLRLRNASDKPLVIDLGGFPPHDATPQRLFVVVQDAQGRPLPHSLASQSAPPPRPRRADYFVTLAPGETWWLAPTYQPAVFGTLPPGSYTVQGVYHNDSDGLADGAPAAALVGQIAGNRLPITIPAEPPPGVRMKIGADDLSPPRTPTEKKPVDDF